MTINELKEKIYKCYSKDLCYKKVRAAWNNSNKYLGMCTITALIVNDYFGGSIGKIRVDGISHYFNIINNKIIDLTKDQFKHDINYDNYEIVERQNIMPQDTINRYNKLKNKLENL